MNILYLAHRIPYPPNKGDKIRSFHQVRNLSRNHNIHLACFVDDPEDMKYVSTLEEICQSVYAIYQSKMTMRGQSLLALATGESLSVSSYYSATFKKYINDFLSSHHIDVIFMFSSVMAQYVQQVPKIPKFMDFVDVDSEKWLKYVDFHKFPLSWIYQLEAGRLAKYEDSVARICDCSLLVTEEEADTLRARVKDRPVYAISNGVDLSYFNSTRSPGPLTSSPCLIFVGAMDYFPNEDAVRFFSTEIFPKVREQLPEIRFNIVGRNPSSDVQDLGRLSGVSVTGEVADIRPFLEQAWVSVAPLRIARGIQNKVLEAMAMGIPLVGTSSAFEGMKVNQGDGVRIANNAQEFASEVLKLVTDSRLRADCSQQARRYVERYHRWEDHGSKLESLFVEIIEAQGH